MRKQQKARIKGVARVKKFNADQDETVDEPEEIIEREFELTPEQVEEVRKGKTVRIENGEITIEERRE